MAAAARPALLCHLRKRIGIIGGAGPDAGVDMLQKILETNKARLGPKYKSDRDAANAILLQEPAIGGPRGEDDLVDKAGAPFRLCWGSLSNSIRTVDLLKCDYFCVSCNTLHILEPEIRAYMAERKSKARFVSLIQETVKRIGVIAHQQMSSSHLGSNATTDMGPTGRSPYAQPLFALASQAGSQITVLQLAADSRLDLQNLLTAIKTSGVDEEKADKLEGIVAKHRFSVSNPHGAHLFVMACSEFPLLLPLLKGKVEDSEVLDPSQHLAEVLIDLDLAGLNLEQSKL